MPDRYINILTIKIFNITMSLSIGNPKYYWAEIKSILKKEGDVNA